MMCNHASRKGKLPGWALLVLCERQVGLHLILVSSSVAYLSCQWS
jgi:hypothetical protein